MEFRARSTRTRCSLLRSTWAALRSELHRPLLPNRVMLGTCHQYYTWITHFHLIKSAQWQFVQWSHVIFAEFKAHARWSAAQFVWARIVRVSDAVMWCEGGADLVQGLWREHLIDTLVECDTQLGCAVEFCLTNYSASKLRDICQGWIIVLHGTDELLDVKVDLLFAALRHWPPCWSLKIFIRTILGNMS